MMPEDVRLGVIWELYLHFDQLQWERLSTSERSRHYEAFLENPKIGQVLKVHLPEGKERVWIKDGPAKEYSRALEGAGAYAKFTTRRAPGPAMIAADAVGPEWILVPDSVQEKPMRCLVRGPRNEIATLLWGSSFKDLYWHAAKQRVGAPKSDRIVIVLTKTRTAPLAPEVSTEHRKLCSLIDASYTEVTRSITRKFSE